MLLELWKAFLPTDTEDDKIHTTRVHVFSGSVFYADDMFEREADEFLENRNFSRAYRIPGQRIGFIWHVYPADTTVNMLRRIQQVFAEAERDLTPTNLPDRIILVCMFNDIDLNRAGNEQMCTGNAQQVAKFLQGFLARSLVQSWSPDLGSLGIMTRLQTLEKSGMRSPRR